MQIRTLVMFVAAIGETVDVVRSLVVEARARWHSWRRFQRQGCVWGRSMLLDRGLFAIAIAIAIALLLAS